jgi:AcrR family transcriptional regulator
MSAKATALQIQRESLRLFHQRGYAGASMREIAASVGIEPPSLYHHFASKEDLLWELIRDVLERIEAAWQVAESGLSDDAGPRARLECFVTSHVIFHAQNIPEASLANSNMVGLRPERLQFVIRLRDHYERHLRAIVAEGASSGEFDVDDQRTTVRAILQMSTAVWTWYQPGGEINMNDLARRYARLAERMVGCQD